jgi:hypothetical protein
MNANYAGRKAIVASAQRRDWLNVTLNGPWLPVPGVISSYVARAALFVLPLFVQVASSLLKPVGSVQLVPVTVVPLVVGTL